jgi:hypothetical protein
MLPTPPPISPLPTLELLQQRARSPGPFLNPFQVGGVPSTFTGVLGGAGAPPRLRRSNTVTGAEVPRPLASATMTSGGGTASERQEARANLMRKLSNRTPAGGNNRTDRAAKGGDGPSPSPGPETGGKEDDEEQQREGRAPRLHLALGVPQAEREARLRRRSRSLNALGWAAARQARIETSLAPPPVDRPDDEEEEEKKEEKQDEHDDEEEEEEKEHKAEAAQDRGGAEHVKRLSVRGVTPENDPFPVRSPPRPPRSPDRRPMENRQLAPVTDEGAPRTPLSSRPPSDAATGKSPSQWEETGELDAASQSNMPSLTPPAVIKSGTSPASSSTSSSLTPQTEHSFSTHRNSGTPRLPEDSFEFEGVLSLGTPTGMLSHPALRNRRRNSDPNHDSPSLSFPETPSVNVSPAWTMGRQQSPYSRQQGNARYPPISSPGSIARAGQSLSAAVAKASASADDLPAVGLTPTASERPVADGSTVSFPASVSPSSTLVTGLGLDDDEKEDDENRSQEEDGHEVEVDEMDEEPERMSAKKRPTPIVVERLKSETGFPSPDPNYRFPSPTPSSSSRTVGNYWCPVPGLFAHNADAPWITGGWKCRHNADACVGDPTRGSCAGSVSNEEWTGQSGARRLTGCAFKGCSQAAFHALHSRFFAKQGRRPELIHSCTSIPRFWRK